jgi:hypothetical protein
VLLKASRRSCENKEGRVGQEKGRINIRCLHSHLRARLSTKRSDPSSSGPGVQTKRKVLGFWYQNHNVHRTLIRDSGQWQEAVGGRHVSMREHPVGVALWTALRLAQLQKIDNCWPSSRLRRFPARDLVTSRIQGSAGRARVTQRGWPLRIAPPSVAVTPRELFRPVGPVSEPSTLWKRPSTRCKCLLFRHLTC